MSEAATLLSALSIAAFQRGADGTFTSLALAPSWFAQLAAEGTLPFLGHILEDAIRFWDERTPGRRDWGPCAAVDKSGHEFHYMVSAITAGDAQYLVMQLDPGSDKLREVLQQVREQALAAPTAGEPATSERAPYYEATIVAAQQQTQRTADQIRSLVYAALSRSSLARRSERGRTTSATAGG